MEGSAILNNVAAVTTPAVAARDVPMTQSGLFVLTSCVPGNRIQHFVERTAVYKGLSSGPPPRKDIFESSAVGEAFK